MTELRRVQPLPLTPLPLPQESAVMSVPTSAPASAIRVNSAQLFAGALEVQIDHHGAIYRLKQTALGKLILTK